MSVFNGLKSYNNPIRCYKASHARSDRDRDVRGIMDEDAQPHYYYEAHERQDEWHDKLPHGPKQTQSLMQGRL
jgi:hypothetical protein